MNLHHNHYVCRVYQNAEGMTFEYLLSASGAMNYRGAPEAQTSVKRVSSMKGDNRLYVFRL